MNTVCGRHTLPGKAGNAPVSRRLGICFSSCSERSRAADGSGYLPELTLTLTCSLFYSHALLRRPRRRNETVAVP